MSNTSLPEPDGRWKDHFQTNTTRVGFCLKLSQPMMEMLCACSDDVHWDRRRYRSIFYPDNFLATEHALTKRGLLQRKPPELVEEERDDYSRPPWELTPVGKACVNMMKVGGIYIGAELARGRLNKRKGYK